MPAFDREGSQSGGAGIWVGNVGDRSKINIHLFIVEIRIGVTAFAALKKLNVRIITQYGHCCLVRWCGKGRNRGADELGGDGRRTWIPEVELEIIGPECVNIAAEDYDVRHLRIMDVLQ